MPHFLRYTLIFCSARLIPKSWRISPRTFSLSQRTPGKSEWAGRLVYDQLLHLRLLLLREFPAAWRPAHPYAFQPGNSTLPIFLPRRADVAHAALNLRYRFGSYVPVRPQILLCNANHPETQRFLSFRTESSVFTSSSFSISQSEHTLQYIARLLVWVNTTASSPKNLFKVFSIREPERRSR